MLVAEDIKNLKYINMGSDSADGGIQDLWQRVI